jgi:hypothetical protein
MDLCFLDPRCGTIHNCTKRQHQITNFEQGWSAIVYCVPQPAEGATSLRQSMKSVNNSRSLNEGGRHRTVTRFCLSGNSTATASEINMTLDAGNSVANNIDKILALELNQLSLKDREALNDEIHGVNFLAVPETPEFVAGKLHEMDCLLRTAHQPSSANMTSKPLAIRNAYEEALLLGSQYIHDSTFRIMFLRSDLFDVNKAACRMLRFLQLLRDYFGPRALLQLPFASLNDLTAEEIQILKQGAFRLLPGRDGAGRLMVGFVSDFGDFPLASKVREYCCCVQKGNQWCQHWKMVQDSREKTYVYALIAMKADGC